MRATPPPACSAARRAIARSAPASPSPCSPPGEGLAAPSTAATSSEPPVTEAPPPSPAPSRLEPLVRLDLVLLQRLLVRAFAARCRTFELKFGLEVGGVGRRGEGNFDRNLVGAQQNQEVLIERLHPLRTPASDELRDLCRLGRVLDALLHGAGAAHDLHRRHAAVLLLVH